MEEILNKLTSFAASKDSRLACAAAVVLAELAPKDSAVTSRLAAALEQGDPVRRQFIIEALGRIGTAEAAEVLVPLIKAEGATSEQALRAVAHTATAALKPLLKMIGTVPPALLERVAECVARTGEAAAFSGLISHLANADVETCRAIRGGLRTAMSSFAERPKELLHKALEKSFGDKALTRHHPALIALLKIGGDLGDISLLKAALNCTGSNFPAHVRRAALRSVGMLHLNGEQRAKLAPKLLPMMLDSDTANIAEPALEALRQAHLASSFHRQLRKMLNSPSQGIREFAMQALAAQGTTGTMHELMACLDSPDRAVREEALSALSRAPAAAGVLCQRLLDMNGGEAALETARALAPQAAHIPGRLFEKLAAQYTKLASAAHTSLPGVDMQRAIVAVFRAGQSPALVKIVYELARKLRAKGEWQRSTELLKAVSGLAGWGAEQKLELALAGLSSGSKDISRSARAVDPHLRLIEEVLSNGAKPKDLARAVLKDHALSRKALHYLGYHFVERMGGERDFGRLILEKLASTRTDEGRQAKEKLVIEGLLKVKGAKAGILEERAKIMMTASDLGAKLNPVRPAPARKSAKRPAKKAVASGKAKKKKAGK